MDNKLLLVNGDLRSKDLKKPGAYQILNKDDEVKYVGSTNNLYNRFSSHKRKLNLGSHENKSLQNYSNEVGGLKLIPIPTATKDEALILEQTYLNNSINNGVLCNISTDARNPAKGITKSEEHRRKLSVANIGNKHTEETKTKMSTAKIGNKFCLGQIHSVQHNEKISSRLIGHEVSQETRDKLVIASTGNQRALGSKKTDEAKNKISEAKGTSVVVNGVPYQSYHKAAAELNCSPTTVMNRCLSGSTKFSDWTIRG